jgi:hypothetical protein
VVIPTPTSRARRSVIWQVRLAVIGQPRAEPQRRDALLK